jgi:hypothetical protein
MNLTQLVELAGRHAESVLIGLGEDLMVTWLMVDADGKTTHILGTPWKDDLEKELTRLAIRAYIRVHKITAYSLVTECWAASAPKGWKPGEPHIRSSEHPDRVEIVIAVATNGKETLWRKWLIKRDSNERVVKLEPEEMDGAKVSSWMTDLL